MVVVEDALEVTAFSTQVEVLSISTSNISSANPEGRELQHVRSNISRLNLRKRLDGA